MATTGRLMLAALTTLVAAAAGAGLEVAVVTTPAPKRPAGSAPAADPAEPPLTVRASYGDAAAGGAPRAGWAGRPVAVAGGAKGVTLTLETPGSWQGHAALAFKGAAPPMRFALRLTKMPSYDLESPFRGRSIVA